MLYQITNGTVSLGGEEILSHIDFEIKDKEKIAIVGRNGVGKTTLLRLLAGELDLDRDDKRMEPGRKSSRKITIGLLHQNRSWQQEITAEELFLKSCPQTELYSREHFQAETEYIRMFTGLGFALEDRQKPLAAFSGGEQTKIALICQLLQKPDVLLLDEPTNHLDISAVEWLEDYIRSYPKAVIFVSHDRFFLDQVVEIVYEIQNGKLKKYHGNYTQYREQKRKDLIAAQKVYERQEEELKRLNELIEKFKHKPKKAAFARSRKKMIERMEWIDKPEKDDVSVFTGPIEPLHSCAKWVIEAKELQIGYEHPLLNIDLRIKKGQKIGIIGPNGAGKTTFLKTIAGLLSPLAGKYQLGNQVELGYFDQHSAEQSSKKTVAEHFHDLFPAMTEKEVRQILGAYLFSGKNASLTVDHLSGGERSRLVLAELLNSRPNLLVLDEPTNHMDIPAKETLESAFRQYTGTILFVSHDRYFIRQVADAILLFENGQVYYYPFGYEHYIRHRRQKKGEDITAMVRAENQALLADLKALPKEERRFARELSTEEAYVDWQLRLIREQIEEKEAIVCSIQQKIASVMEQMQWTEELDSLEEELSRSWDAWTEQCLRWAEVALFEEERR